MELAVLLENSTDIRGIPFVNYRKVMGTKHLYRTAYAGVSGCLTWLHDQGITSVIDFRSVEEIEQSTLAELVKEQKIAYLNFPIGGYEGILKNLKNPGIEDYVEYYLRIMSAGTDAFRAFFDFIGQSDDKGILFGCYAGKDRTGLASMLILSLLGVDKEIIHQDFIATNDQLKLNVSAFEQNWMKRNISKEEYLQRILLKKELFDRLHKAIEVHYGSVEMYITEELKISRKSKHLIISKLT